jgi:multicomponent K+:H+ antiporter subunit E
MRRLVPSPILSGALFVLWLLLNQSATAGSVALGVLLAWAFPLLTAKLRPAPVRIRRPVVALRLIARVIVDLLRSNVAVGTAILFRSSGALHSSFVRVPLEVRDPNALAVLAMIVCMTPGTAWAQVALDRSALLIHVLDSPDEDAAVAFIKRRYERPLMEIFE